MTGHENRTVTLLYWPVVSLASSQPLSMLMPIQGKRKRKKQKREGRAAASTGCSMCTLYSVINSIYLRPVQRRVHPCRNLSVCRASLSPAWLVANSRPFRNREEPSILITGAVVRRFKTPLHTIPPPPPLLLPSLGFTSLGLFPLCVSLFQYNKRLM